MLVKQVDRGIEELPGALPRLHRGASLRLPSPRVHRVPHLIRRLLNLLKKVDFAR